MTRYTGRRRALAALLGLGSVLAAVGVTSPARADGSNCNAQQPPDAGSPVYHKAITDPDTGYRYDVDVDNPQDCAADLGAADPFIATYNGSKWVFSNPAVQPGFWAVPATVPSCPAIIEYSARGTLEDLDEYTGTTTPYSKYWSKTGLANDHGAGVIGLAVYKQLQAVQSAPVGLYADYYPADDVLSGTNVATLSALAVASIEAGTNRAVADLNKLSAACPSSRLLLVGYSQGAMVLRRALASPSLSSSVASPRALVQFFGDAEFRAGETNQPGSPSYNPSLAATTLLGTFTGGHTGLALQFEPSLIPNAPAVPSRFRVFSWCHDQEIVCQTWGGIDQHLSYGTQDGYAAGRVAAAYFATTSFAGGAAIPPSAAVPTVYRVNSACTTLLPPTTQETIRLDGTGSPAGQSVLVQKNIGYVNNGTITPTASGATTITAGAASNWVSNLPFVLGQPTFRYAVTVPGVLNPRAWTTFQRTTQAPEQLYDGLLTALC